jgi:hypothetical protein
VDEGTLIVSVAVFPAANGLGLMLNVIREGVVLADNVTVSA